MALFRDLSIPYRFNESLSSASIRLLRSSFQFLIGSMKVRFTIPMYHMIRVSIPYRLNESAEVQHNYDNFVLFQFLIGSMKDVPGEIEATLVEMSFNSL